MMVPHINQQAGVLVEAVQNHTPDVIICDEIGREKEVEARKSAESVANLIQQFEGGTENTDDLTVEKSLTEPPRKSTRTNAVKDHQLEESADQLMSLISAQTAAVRRLEEKIDKVRKLCFVRLCKEWCWLVCKSAQSIICNRSGLLPSKLLMTFCIYIYIYIYNQRNDLNNNHGFLV